MTRFTDTSGFRINVGDELRDINSIYYRVINSKECIDNDGTVHNLENDKFTKI